MNEKILKYLFDIKIAILEIDGFFDEEERNYFSYKSNILLKRGIERNLEIIGEATNRILKVNPSIEITNSKRIIGLRNQIIHHYDSISDENIWSIVTKNLPLLLLEIDKLILEYTND